MNAYEFAIANNVTGTDAEIVSKLKTVTNGNIASDKIQSWLFDNGLWFEGPGGVMGGLLQTVYDNPSTPSQVKQALAEFYAAVWSAGKKEIRTTQVQFAVRIAAAINLIAAQAPEITSLVSSFYALDGGLRWPSLTVEQFASQRTEAEALAEKKAALDAIEDRANAAIEAAKEVYRSAEGTPTEITAAGEAAFAG